MDSLTQAVLGASVAGAAAPAGYRRKAMFLGAALGTLPDLDVFINYGDAVKNFTYHRGFSHSIFVLVPLSLLIWGLLRKVWRATLESPLRWLAAISLALITHPLLDAHTAYGTQLFWPLDVAPTMWATIFIIDPAFTLPLAIGVGVAFVWPTLPRAAISTHAGLWTSCLYLSWTWLAQSLVSDHIDKNLQAMGIVGAEVFLTPTPLNTLLWRVVVRTQTGYLEGFESLAIDEGPVVFQHYDSDVDVLRDVDGIWAVERLRWFAQDFVAYHASDERLVITDLRMGQSPNFVFRHVVASRDRGAWRAVTPTLLPFSFSERSLADTWQRIWGASSLQGFSASAVSVSGSVIGDAPALGTLDKTVTAVHGDVARSTATSIGRPDKNGLIGRNRTWGQMHSVRFQYGSGRALRYGHAVADAAVIRMATHALNAGLGSVGANGEFPLTIPASLKGKVKPGRSDQASAAAFFLSDICPALLIVGAQQTQTDQVTLAVKWLADRADGLLEHDRQAPNRLLINALAFSSCGALIGDRRIVNRADEFIGAALKFVRKDGVFMEAGGSDTSYQAVSLVVAQELQLTHYTGEYAVELANAWRSGVDWLAQRIAVNGVLDSSGNTRTCANETFIGRPKDVNLREVMWALTYAQADLQRTIEHLSAFERWLQTRPAPCPA